MRRVLSSTKPFIFVLLPVGVTVRSAESLSSAIPLGLSTKRANSKRANHGRSRLFQDAVSSVSFWLRSFPVCGWLTRSLSSVFGLPTRWRCVRGRLMHLLWAYEHDFAAISPFLYERIGTLCRHPCWSLWLEQRIAGWRSGRSEGYCKSFSAGTPPRTSYSSCSEHPVWFPGDFAGLSHGAPSISFNLGRRVEPLAGERRPPRPSQAPSRPGSRRSGPDAGNPEMLEFALSQETARTAPLLPLVESREENLPFLFRRWSKGQRYPLSQESVISFSSGFSGPWDDSVRRPASSLSPTTHFASSQESTVRGRHSSPRTSGQSRLGPREFGEDASERTAFCTIHPYSLSLHHHRYVDCAVGAACTASGGVAHAAQPVSLAHAHNSTRLRDSVRHATSQVQRRSRDVGGSPERPCLARGDCCPPGKGRNLAGPSSREEAGVLQPLLHRTQETWWPSTNPGSPSFEPGFIQAPVQDADAQAHYQMHLAPGLVCSDRPEGCLLSCFDPSVTQTVLAFLRLKVGHGSTGSSPSDSPCLPVCSRRP